MSVTRLSVLLRDVAAEYEERAQIETINLGFKEAAEHLRSRSDEFDVVLAAGSNGSYLRNRLSKPVVLIKPSGFDLMQALARARSISPRIGLITHETYLPAFAEFQRSFDLDIKQRSFVTEEEARNSVAELKSRGVEVIVGTGMVSDLAERAGLPGILLYTADSVRAAFEGALDLARAVDLAADSGPRFSMSPGRKPSRFTCKYGLDHLVGESAVMVAVRTQLSLYAASDATVLIEGETGTGKELAAQALHAASHRRAQPFVAVNCGAIAESLLESELFGHDEGAFTGSRRGGRVGLIEAAQNGTLFLDEIGEMPLPLQTRLLRVLEEREIVRVGASRPIPVDVRIVTATHCSLEDLTQAGRFRRDLYYRLNVLRLRLPALAERRDDIPLLATDFLKTAFPGRTATWTHEALVALSACNWPGNVRELRNVVERIAVLCASHPVTEPFGLEHLRRWVPELWVTAGTNAFTAPFAIATDGRDLAALPGPRGKTREELKRVLDLAGSQEKACAMLGISRSTLWRRLREDAVIGSVSP